MEVSESGAPPERRDIILALCAGVLYVLPILFRDPILARLAGIPPTFTTEHLRSIAGTHQLWLLSLRLPALIVVLLACTRLGDGTLRSALRVERWGPLFAAAATTVLLAYVLNALTIFPYSWRWDTNSAFTYASVLVRAGAWLPLGVWACTLVLVVPLIEEVVFRFGVLRLGVHVMRSRIAGALVSSALFALGHTGYWPPDQQHVRTGIWMFLLGGVFCATTLRRGGRINSTLAMHAALNLSEFLMMLLAVYFSLP